MLALPPAPDALAPPPPPVPDVPAMPPAPPWPAAGAPELPAVPATGTWNGSGSEHALVSAMHTQAMTDEVFMLSLYPCAELEETHRRGQVFPVLVMHAIATAP
jgi:hypothetical protein